MILRFPSLCALAMLLIGACQSKNDLSIAPFPENKSAALSLTFDDGCITGLTKISPLLREYDITGTFFLNPVFISQDSIWEQWRILANQGFEIGNHGYSHISLENIVDDSVLQFEVERSRETIEQRVDKRVISFAHPYDRSNIIADSVVLKNHIASRIIPDRKSLKLAMDSKTSFENINSFISKVIKRQRMSCVSIHGIDNDCWEPISMQTFTHLLNTIQKNKDELFVSPILVFHDRRRKSAASSGRGSPFHSLGLFWPGFGKVAN